MKIYRPRYLTDIRRAVVNYRGRIHPVQTRTEWATSRQKFPAGQARFTATWSAPISRIFRERCFQEQTEYVGALREERGEEGRCFYREGASTLLLSLHRSSCLRSRSQPTASRHSSPLSSQPLRPAVVSFLFPANRNPIFPLARTPS